MKIGTVKQFDYTNYSDLLYLSDAGYLTIGITYDEKDPFFITTDPSISRRYKLLKFIIETVDEEGTSSFSTVAIGKTDMYEIAQPIMIKGISFPNGVPQSIQVNVCSYSKEGEE